jgi:hypothetical protein
MKDVASRSVGTMKNVRTQRSGMVEEGEEREEIVAEGGGLKWKIVGHGKCKCKKDLGWWILDERRTKMKDCRTW